MEEFASLIDDSEILDLGDDYPDEKNGDEDMVDINDSPPAPPPHQTNSFDHEYEDDKLRNIFDNGVADDLDISSDFEDDFENVKWEPVAPAPEPNLSDAQKPNHKAITGAPKMPYARPENSSKILKLKHKSNQKASDGGAPLRSKSDWYRRDIFALEQKQNIEYEILQMQEKLKKVEGEEKHVQSKFTPVLVASGLSQELYDAYEAFCESLVPEFGQRGGFSITCDVSHDGSYIEYDP